MLKSTTSTKTFARQLRTQQTDAEKKLWQVRRSRQFVDTKFKRQVPIPPYIVDFYCHSSRLIIEIDGGQHVAIHHEDAVRSRFLKRRHLRVIRFTNIDVLTNLEGVAHQILQSLNEVSVPTIPPST